MPEIMEKAKAKGVEIVLPIDFVCSSKYGEDFEPLDKRLRLEKDKPKPSL